MQMYIRTIGLTDTLILTASTYREGKILTRFARPSEPLKVEIKKDPPFTNPHIEITKET